jgi:hypothetical protein
MSNKISYSQYTMWANCPMAWKLKYVEENILMYTLKETGL